VKTMLKGFYRSDQLLRLGKIRLGEKTISAGSGREHPKDLQHFLVPPEVEAVTGPNPTTLKVMLPSADWEQVCPTALEKWVKWGEDRRLMCKGDGQLVIKRRDENMNWLDGDDDLPCAYKACPEYLAGNCTEVGRLNVILPDVNLLGVYTIDTGSFYGLNQVYAAFASAVMLLENLVGNPELITRAECILAREMTSLEYQDPKSGQRKQVSKAILKLTIPPISMPAVRSLQAASPLQQLPAGELPDLPPAPGYTPGPVAAPEMPPPDESCPEDIAPGMAPVGPDLGQKAAWDVLVEQVQALGKNAVVFERSVCEAIRPDAARFEDLAGETEAAQALTQGAQMIEGWQQASQPTQAAEARKQAARKAAAPKPRSGGEGLQF